MNKISVVTVTYNCEKILEATVESIINQTYPNVEYIIIDGASTDGTVEVINKYRSYIACFKSESDKGIFDAMNKAIDMATGDWIIFMNAGDCFADADVLESLSAYMRPQVSAIYGRVNVLTLKGIVTGERPLPFFENKSKFKPMGVSHQSIVLSMKELGNIRFDLKYKIAADYDMIKRVYEVNPKFVYADIPISIIDATDGLSANNRRRQRDEEAKICGVYDSLNYKIWTNYKSLRAFVKRLVMRR